MKLFNRKKDTEIAPVDTHPVVSVRDIKDYLVNEYERVNSLKKEIKYLEDRLENAREIQVKYDATLVTLDEYSRRLKGAEFEIAQQKEKTAKARQETDKYRDEVNSYKIMINNAALTKEEIKGEIIRDFKRMVIAEIDNIKGNLSKQKVHEIIAGIPEE